MIVEVKTYHDQKLFAKVGVSFSKSYPDGIPFFYKEQLDLLDESKNFVLKHGGKLKCFMFQSKNEFKGRVAAIINKDFNEKIGFVGLFDCVHDYQVASELLNAACTYLHTHGCEQIVGPFNFSIYSSYRFMIEGFDNKSYLGEPRNPAYYPEFFEKFGFTKSHTWESTYFTKDEIASFALDKKTHFDLLSKMDYSFVHLNDTNQHKIMEDTYGLLVQSYKVFPFYTPISKEDFLDQYASVPQVMDRDCSVFVYNAEQELVAFTLLMRDLTAAIRKMNAKTGFMAKLRFLMNRNKGNMVNLAQGGSLPVHIREAAVTAYKQHGKRVSLSDATLFYSAHKVLEKDAYQHMVISLVRDGAEIRMHYDGISEKKSQYALYTLNLERDV